ncbi:hypothetical protein K445DRAFT_212763 [Daldinia sp. EC12]|nr:hypothetical protein K445DRAFT_212763 [Daldinia sp. EC12]
MLADVQNLLKHLVRGRDIVWNNAFRTKFHETNDNGISALILQVTGQKAEIPCDKCTEGKGPFHGCIVLPPNAPLGLRQSMLGCANCHYKNKQSQCSLRIASQKTDLELEQSEVLPAGSNSKKRKTITTRDSKRSGFSRQQSVSNSQNDVDIAPTTPISPAQTLGLETWEISPGRIRDEQSEAVYNFAFSNSYLARSQAVRIGREVSFQVVTIKPGTVHYWSASASKLRLCSIASGKLQMSIHGQDFSIGLNGMIRIRPGVECTAMNKLYIDATVHVTIVPGDLCG